MHSTALMLTSGRPCSPSDRISAAVDLSFSHIPKVLSGCLHTTCQSCAEESLQRSSVPGVLPCPLCTTPTTTITTNQLTNNVIALQDVKRHSTHCDFCDDTVDASHRCVDCESMLCNFHVKNHLRSRGTKTHEVLSLKSRGGVNAGIEAASVALHVPMFCPRHDDVPAKLFCSEPCGVMICHDCSVAEHSGHSVFLADSDGLDVSHRTRLTRKTAGLRYR